MSVQPGLLKSPREKKTTRSLYEEVFPEDSERFLDYYYGTVCESTDPVYRNVIAAAEEDGKVISMVHLNPYRMQFFGKEIRAFYIYAVATDKNRRHEGLMRACLDLSFSFLLREHAALAWLLPVDPAIYAPFGFEKIADFVTCPLPFEKVRRDSDVFLIQDETYRKRKEEEARIAREDGENGSDLPENPVLMGKITDPEAFDQAAGRKFSSDGERLLFLRNSRVYLDNEV